MLYIETAGNDVTLIHYDPFNPRHGLGKTLEQLEQTGFCVLNMPEEVPQPGKTSVLKGDKQTKKLWWEYETRPLTADEEIASLKQDIATLNFQLMVSGVV